MKFIVYQDAWQEWRWRAVARNKKIIADSGEGYKKRSHAIRMAKQMATANRPVFLQINSKGDLARVAQ